MIFKLSDIFFSKRERKNSTETIDFDRRVWKKNIGDKSRKIPNYAFC